MADEAVKLHRAMLIHISRDAACGWHNALSPLKHSDTT